jgi:hypothetical protein
VALRVFGFVEVVLIVVKIDTTRPVDLTQLTTRLASMIQTAGPGEDTAVKTHQH